VRTRGIVRRFNLAKYSPKNSRDFLTVDCDIITILKPINPMHDLIQLQPYDELNRELEANVHPPDWINPKPSGRYNLVVIGAGTAGLVAAAGAARLGAKVALIERELLGGTASTLAACPPKLY
jgi:hypothetical protein